MCAFLHPLWKQFWLFGLLFPNTWAWSLKELTECLFLCSGPLPTLWWSFWGLGSQKSSWGPAHPIFLNLVFFLYIFFWDKLSHHIQSSRSWLDRLVSKLQGSACLQVSTGIEEACCQLGFFLWTLNAGPRLHGKHWITLSGLLLLFKEIHPPIFILTLRSWC